MANVKITDLAAYTAPETTDVMPIVDVTTDTTKKVAVGEIVAKVTGDVDVATDGTSSITAGAIVDADVNANAEIAVSKLADGTARQLLQTDAAGTGVEWTSNVDVPGTLDVTGATTLDSTLQVGGNTTIEGNLTVEGTTTTIETTTLLVEDKNIEMGVVDTPTDTTADGGGITLKGATDKTINWVNATNAWTSSEHIDLASGKEFYIDGNGVLNATTLGSGVVNSSLTSVGTISSGTWQGTAIDDAYLATISTAGKVSNSATTATSSNTASAIVARDASGDFTAGTITADLTGNADTATALSSTRTFEVTGDITGAVSSDLTSGASIATSIASGVIVDADVNASAAIAGTKIDPDFGSQTVETTGVFSAAGGAEATPSIAFTGDLNTGIYSPGADQVAISTGGTGRLFIDSSGNVGVGDSPDSLLDIKGSTPIFYIEDTAAYGSAGSQIIFRGLDSGGSPRNMVNVTGVGSGSNSGELVIQTRNSGSLDDRVVITSDGKVGLGTSSPGQPLDIYGTKSAPAYLRVTNGSNTTWDSGDIFGGIEFYSADTTSNGPGVNAYIKAVHTRTGSGHTSADSSLVFGTGTPADINAVDRLTIDSAGKVGVGTTSPGTILDIRETATGATTAISLFNTDNTSSTAQTARIGLSPDSRGAALAGLEVYKENADFSTSAGRDVSLAFNVLLNNSKAEAARIDSSGRLLVGTSTAPTAATTLVLKGNSASTNTQGRIHIQRSAAPGDGDFLGDINFMDTSNGIAGSIGVARDGGTWTAGSSTPGRLVFSTTADGGSSPTERMRISEDGSIGFNTTGSVIDSTATSRFAYNNSLGFTAVQNTAFTVLYVGRNTNDGTLVEFRQENVAEGSISVSGTTVSYNGAHLSRWSQITGVDPHDKADRPEILRGTVMSNLDEMCDWIDPESGESQDNEQLNKTKISDVEGDKNVAGIFQSWDDDDDTWVNDYYLAMTGDFVIRIATGVTVERGDLLMSAGDGTAKPQDDDIIRSMTIAKVTSTTVSCTYEDGSYCVPCVLMAC